MPSGDYQLTDLTQIIVWADDTMDILEADQVYDEYREGLYEDLDKYDDYSRHVVRDLIAAKTMFCDPQLDALKSEIRALKTANNYLRSMLSHQTRQLSK